MQKPNRTMLGFSSNFSVMFSSKDALANMTATHLCHPSPRGQDSP